MKKLFTLLIALALLALAMTPALAEAAAETVEAVSETAEAATESSEAVAETTEPAAESAAEPNETVAEEAVEEAATETSPVFEKLLQVPWYTWAVLAALVVAAILLTVGAKKAKWNSRRLTMGAMCIAIAFIASCIQLVRMPQGGCITPASMLPLILFMVACGPIQGFVVGCAFGFLMLITDPYVIHPIQLLVDYPLAYGALILGCVATNLPIKKHFQLPLAVLLAGIGRYVMAVLSGAIFFAEYAGEQNAWIYSMVYNLSYIGPDTLVCMVIAAIPGMWQLVEMIRGKTSDAKKRAAS